MTFDNATVTSDPSYPNAGFGFYFKFYSIKTNLLVFYYVHHPVIQEFICLIKMHIRYMVMKHIQEYVFKFILFKN
jgi:hypothetical protein